MYESRPERHRMHTDERQLKLSHDFSRLNSDHGASNDQRPAEISVMMRKATSKKTGSSHPGQNHEKEETGGQNA